MPVLETKDGALVPYAEDGAGPPVLLVHGWAAHGGFFDQLRLRLASRHRVITPTLRGHPGAAGGSTPLSIEILGEDIAALADALDLREAVALGWSMGAMALWSAAPTLNGRLAGLMVEEMSPKVVNEGEWRFGIGGAYGAGDVAQTLSEIATDWPAFVARFAPRLYAARTREARPDLVAWTASEMMKADPEAMSALWSSMAVQDFRGALRAIDMPMLVIRGAESQVHPDGATEYVANAAPRAHRLVIPGAGHVPHLEAPDLFFEHVEAFARQARRRDVLREGAQP